MEQKEIYKVVQQGFINNESVYNELYTSDSLQDCEQFCKDNKMKPVDYKTRKNRCVRVYIRKFYKTILTDVEQRKENRLFEYISKNHLYCNF